MIVNGCSIFGIVASFTVDCSLLLHMALRELVIRQACNAEG